MHAVARKLVFLGYCTQPIFCGIDAITDKYCAQFLLSDLENLQVSCSYYSGLLVSKCSSDSYVLKVLNIDIQFSLDKPNRQDENLL